MRSIAIIGTGVAGMGAAYFLRDQYDITFYEKNNYPGGHTNTLTVDEDGSPIYVDSAFMVYNEVTYPNLTRLFAQLGVETKPASMSFSVQHIPTGLEYNGAGLNRLFAQRRNLFNPKFWKMLMEMARFGRECNEVLENEKYSDATILDYAKERKYGDDFLLKFLIPMSSAVWSAPAHVMLNFPVVTLVRFFKNHGFLGLTTHYQWRTVVGGSRMYRDKILSLFKGKVLLNNPVKKVSRGKDKVKVTDANGKEAYFDKVIFACHADETLKILTDANSLEKDLLGQFHYQKNKATLHTDDRFMPKRKLAWASWNYRIDRDKTGNMTATTIYDMNSLQQVSKKKNYFVTINDNGEIYKSNILWEGYYDHPIYNASAVQAQERLSQLNCNGQVYFCGSYFKYGFHEDALTSGIDVAKKITGKKDVWS